MADSSSLTVSESAARRIQHLQSKRGDPALKLRVVVDSGGCSGFQYKMEFCNTHASDDCFFTEKGVTVLVDPVSLEYLAGAEIDYVESLMGAAFQVRNPNAASSCGCGASFSV